MKRIPLLVPHVPRADNIVPYLRQIDANRWYTNFGPLSRAFEERLAVECGPGFDARHVTTVSNCTVGLELALQALGLQPGARVLIPAITFVATATAVLRVGMVPVLGDVDPRRWVLTPAIAEAACSHGGVDAILTVSTFGFAHDAAEWDALSERLGIPVVIDAAGAFGNQHAGRNTDVVYSFHATKSFAAAEGGAVVSASPERIEAIRRLANFGIDTRIGQLREVGTNGKMSEYHCAIGLASFDAWDETQRARRDLHAQYLAVLATHCPEVTLQDKSADGVYPLMVAALPRGVDMDAIRAALEADGIETRRWYSPSLNRHPALVDVPVAGSIAAAEDLGERLLGLPFYIGLEESEVVAIARALSSAIALAGATA